MNGRVLVITGINIEYHVKYDCVDDKKCEDCNKYEDHIPSLHLEFMIVPPTHYIHQADIAP